MKIFKPLTEMRDLFGGVLEKAKTLMEGASGGGLKGMMMNWMDLDLPGIMKSTDQDFGKGVLLMTMDGDQEGIEATLRFRNYAIERMEELFEMGQIGEGIGSDDLEEVKKTARRMDQWLMTRGINSPVTDKGTRLEEEIARLRGLNAELTSYLRDVRDTVGAIEAPGITEVLESARAGEEAARPESGRIVAARDEHMNVRPLRQPGAGKR